MTRADLALDMIRATLADTDDELSPWTRIERLDSIMRAYDQAERCAVAMGARVMTFRSLDGTRITASAPYAETGRTIIVDGETIPVRYAHWTLPEIWICNERGCELELGHRGACAEVIHPDEDLPF